MFDMFGKRTARFTSAKRCGLKNRGMRSDGKSQGCFSKRATTIIPARDTSDTRSIQTINDQKQQNHAVRPCGIPFVDVS